MCKCPSAAGYHPLTWEVSVSPPSGIPEHALWPGTYRGTPAEVTAVVLFWGQELSHTVPQSGLVLVMCSRSQSALILVASLSTQFSKCWKTGLISHTYLAKNLQTLVSGSTHLQCVCGPLLQYRKHTHDKSCWMWTPKQCQAEAQGPLLGNHCTAKSFGTVAYLRRTKYLFWEWTISCVSRCDMEHQQLLPQLSYRVIAWKQALPTP